jgi:hypothetical protein
LQITYLTKDYYLKYWMFWNMPAIPGTKEVEIGTSKSEARIGKSMRLFEKQTQRKRIGDVDQAVKHLPSKHEASSTKKAT